MAFAAASLGLESGVYAYLHQSSVTVEYLIARMEREPHAPPQSVLVGKRPEVWFGLLVAS